MRHMRIFVLGMFFLTSQLLAQTILEVRPPVDITHNSAMLQGELLNLADLSTDVWFVYGPEDKGNDFAGWSYHVYAGQLTLPTTFDVFVTNLLPNTEYYYRITTANDIGGTWSSEPAAVMSFWTQPETGGDMPYFKVYGIPDAVLRGAPQSVTVEAWYGGEPMVNYAGTVSFSSWDDDTVVPDNFTFQPTDNGVRTFTNAVIFNTLGQFNDIQVQDSMDPDMHGAQYGIFAYAGYTDTAERLMIWNYPWRSYIGEWHSVSVAAVDRYWNIATNYTGTIHFSTDDPAASLPPGGTQNYSFSAQDGGWRTFENDFQFNTVGIHWLRVQDDSNPDMYDMQHDLIAMGHGFSTQVTHLVINSIRRTQPGIGNHFQVMAHNIYEQQVESFTGLVMFECTDPDAEYPDSYVFEPDDRGWKSFDEALIFHTPGAHTFTATWADDSTVSGSLDVEVYHDEPQPFFHVNPRSDAILGWEWPADQEIEIEIGVDLANPDYSTSIWSDQHGFWKWWIDDVPINITTGIQVRVACGDFIKEHTVRALGWFPVVDAAANTVSGTATPGERVVVSVWGSYREVTVGPEGFWTVDLSGEDGSSGAVFIEDADGDATMIPWHYDQVDEEIFVGWFEESSAGDEDVSGMFFFKLEGNGIHAARIKTPLGTWFDLDMVDWWGHDWAMMVEDESVVLLDQDFPSGVYEVVITGTDWVITNSFDASGLEWPPEAPQLLTPAYGAENVSVPDAWVTWIEAENQDFDAIDIIIEDVDENVFLEAYWDDTSTASVLMTNLTVNSWYEIDLAFQNVKYGVTDTVAIPYTAMRGRSVYSEFITASDAGSPSITASSSDGGSIAPSGTTSVTYGANQTFTITPDFGYHIADVVVNGTSVGVTNEYTFVAVTDSVQTIHATFAINNYSVTYLAESGGWVSGVATQVVEHGSDTDMVEAVPDTGYYFIQWNDGVSTAQRTDASVTNDITVTAQFALHEYELVIESAHGTIEPALGTHTNSYGTIVTNTVELFIIDGSTQYVSTGWVMTGHEPLSGSDHSFEMIVTNNAALTWQWATNYWLEVTDVSNGSVDVADGWYADGTNLWLTAIPDTGYVFAGWSGDVMAGYENDNPLETVMDAPKTLTPSFTLDEHAITASAGVGGSIDPEGEVWVPHGSNITFTITPETGYSIADVYVDGSSIGPTNSYTFVNVTNEGHTIDVYFALNKHVLAVDSEYGMPWPERGLHTNNWGTVISASVEPFVEDFPTQHVSVGWVGTGSVPSGGTSNSVDFVLEEDSSLTWLWGTNYWLDIGSHPDGTVDKSSDWYTADSTVVLTAIANSNYMFTGWTGDIVSSDNPLSLMLDSPMSVQPEFVAADHEIMATAGPGGSITPDGAAWVTHGSNLTFTIMPDTGHSISNVWVDGISIGPTNSYTFMNVTNSGHTIDAFFSVNQYTLTFDSAGGSEVDSITQDFGSSITPPDDPERPGHTFGGWVPLVPETMPAMDQTHVAQWAIDQYTLMVSSVHGSPLPPQGANTFDWGTGINALVEAVITGTHTQYVNIGWVGAGSVPTVGTSNAVSFVLEDDSSLTWLWDTNYWLEVGAPTHGSVDTGSQWVPSGSDITLLATADTGYHFAGWTGSVDEEMEDDNPLTLTMDQSHTVTPLFVLAEGAVQVTLNHAAVLAGARWRLTHGPDTGWKSSGDVVESLPVDDSPYTVRFEGLPFYVTPDDITGIEISVGGTEVLSAHYHAQMAALPGGTFQMGASGSTEGRSVELDSFLMDVRPVTIGQFMEFALDTGINMPPAPTWGGDMDIVWQDLDPELPMVNVTWNQARAYASWAGKRLPTEAEFEYAMRSGLVNQLYPWGNTIASNRANYDDHVGMPTVAGTYAANTYGLYDIVGNVWEWCSDWHALIPGGDDPLVNPQGPGSGTYKMIRGGSFVTRALMLQTPWRFFYTPNTRSTDLGFRCVQESIDLDGPLESPMSEEPPEWWVKWNFGAGSGHEYEGEFDPDADWDGDGMTNREEYLAGSDPNDPNSVLRVSSLRPIDGGVEIEWQSAPDRTYTLLRSSAGAPFEAVAEGIPATPPYNVYVDTPPGSGPWFYRVAVEL